MAETVKIEIPITATDKTDGGVSSAQKRLSAFEKSVEKVQRQMEKMDGSRCQIDVDADEKASDKMSEAEDRMHRLDGSDATVDIGANDSASGPISEAEDRLEQLDGDDATVDLGADDSASGPISDVGDRLEQLDGSDATVDLSADDAASGPITEVSDQLGALDGNDAVVDINAEDNASGPLSNVDDALSELDGKAATVLVNAAGNGLDILQGTAGNLAGLNGAAIAGLAGVTGASFGISDSINTYREFEATMSSVEAISGATESQLVSLTDKARQMGATTKFTATESAEAFTYMAMAGWKSEEMLSGIEGIMNLAAASGESIGTTSDIVTDALTAFGLKAADSTHFADVLAQASSNANTNVSMMGESFKYVAPLAGAMHYSIEDTALALGLMANAGVKASMSGTALRRAITSLAKPSEQQATYMEKYGISLTDSEGRIKSLNEVMVDLRENLGGLDDDVKTEAVAGMFGNQAMSGMLAIINATESDWEKLSSAVNNADGAAADMAGIMLDNMEGSFALMQSAIAETKMILGERLTPYLRGLADSVAAAMPDAADAISGLMDKVDALANRVKDRWSAMVSTSDWKSAGLGGKVNMAFDRMIAQPVARWASTRGKSLISSAIGGLFEEAVKILPGGEDAGLTSWLSAGLIGSGIVKAVQGINSLTGALTSLWPAASVAVPAAAGIAAAIGGIALAIDNVNQKRITADLDARFGDITLSTKEIEQAASWILHADYMVQVEYILDAAEKAEQARQTAEDALKANNEILWQAQLNMVPDKTSDDLYAELTREAGIAYEDAKSKAWGAILWTVAEQMYPGDGNSQDVFYHQLVDDAQSAYESAGELTFDSLAWVIARNLETPGKSAAEIYYDLTHNEIAGYWLAGELRLDGLDRSVDRTLTSDGPDSSEVYYDLTNNEIVGYDAAKTLTFADLAWNIARTMSSDGESAAEIYKKLTGNEIEAYTLASSLSFDALSWLVGYTVSADGADAGTIYSALTKDARSAYTLAKTWTPQDLKWMISYIVEAEGESDEAIYNGLIKDTAAGHKKASDWDPEDIKWLIRYTAEAEGDDPETIYGALTSAAEEGYTMASSWAPEDVTWLIKYIVNQQGDDAATIWSKLRAPVEQAVTAVNGVTTPAKPKVEITLTAKQADDYRANIDTFIASKIEELEKETKAAHVAVHTFLDGVEGTEAGKTLADQVQEWAQLDNLELTDLSKQLSESVEKALKDGVLDTDEMEIVQALQDKINAITSRWHAATSQAKMDWLSQEYGNLSGKALTDETFAQIVEALDTMAATNRAKTQEATEYAYSALAGMKFGGRIDEEQYSYYKDLVSQASRNMKASDLQNGLDFMNTTMKDAFSDVMAAYRADTWQNSRINLPLLKTRADAGLMTGQNSVALLLNSGAGDYLGHNDSMAELWEYMKPSASAISSLIDEYVAVGQEIPASLMKSFSTSMEIGAAAGDVDAATQVWANRIANNADDSLKSAIDGLVESGAVTDSFAEAWKRATQAITDEPVEIDGVTAELKNVEASMDGELAVEAGATVTVDGENVAVDTAGIMEAVQDETPEVTTAADVTTTAGDVDATPAKEAADAELDELFAEPHPTDGSADITITQTNNASDVYSAVGEELQGLFSSTYYLNASAVVTIAWDIANPTESISFSGSGSGSVASVSASFNAAGGLIGGPTLSWVGEEGPEMIIPLVSGRRQRGVDLWRQAGSMLGIPGFASGGLAGADEDLVQTPFEKAAAMSGIGYVQQENGGAPIAFVAGTSSQKEGTQPAPGASNGVNVNVTMNPVIQVDGAKLDEEEIFEVMKRRIREVADDVGGEIADRIMRAFDNMPLGWEG